MVTVELFERAQDLINEILTRRLAEELAEGLDGSLIKKVLTIRYERRLWLINNVEDLKDLWGFIREDSTLCDLILNSTYEFRLRLTTKPEAYNQFVKHLAESFTCCSNFYGEETLVIDNDLLDRLPTRDDFYTLLATNPWFVFLVVLSISPIELLDNLVTSLKTEGD
jgi:hypothetical protein